MSSFNQQSACTMKPQAAPDINKGPLDSIQPEFKLLTAEMKRYLDLDDIGIALDVGSRDAIAALTMAKAFPNARVFAFECNLPAVELCRRNAAMEPRVTVVDRAVSDVDGDVTFYAIDPVRTGTPHPDGNIGASSLFVANPAYPYERYVQNPITVSSITLGAWAKENRVREVDLMWLDLQGAELKALQGMGELLSHVKFIHTEVEFKPIYLDQPLAKDIYDYLEKAGFVECKIIAKEEWAGIVLFRRRDLKPLAAA